MADATGYVCLKNPFMQHQKRTDFKAMIHQRSTTYHETTATAARSLEVWAEPASSTPEPAGVHWLSVFVRTAYRTVSPDAAREFFRELDASDPLLSRLGW